MRQKIFVLLTVSAVLTMALAGCAQTDDRTYEQSAEEGGKDTAAPSAEQTKEEQENSENSVSADSDVPVVYMTTDISARWHPQGCLMLTVWRRIF